MAKSRKQKNKKIYDELEIELKNNKEDSYEKKLKSIDPKLDSKGELITKENKPNIVKRNENKSNSSLTVIAKKVNGEKRSSKKNEVTIVKKEKNQTKVVKEKSKTQIIEEEILNEPISYTDKLSIEEILRTKLEQQQKLRQEKRNIKKSPNDDKYTPEMMQKTIKPHLGVDVRKLVGIRHSDYRWVAMTILVLALISIIIIGVLLIFKVI